MRLVIVCFFLLLSIIQVNPLYAQVVQTDFDQDGKSDLTLVVIESDGSLSWKSLSSSTGVLSSLGTLGRSGDHIILANWRGSSLPEKGVVSFNKTTNSIVWKIVDESNVLHQSELGKKGDAVISGADFNGNGYADAAVARLRSKSVVWDISSDLFSENNQTAQVKRIRFGSNGSRIFFTNPDGVRDWLGEVHRNKRGKTILRLKDAISGNIRSVSRFPSWISKEPRPRPFPVSQADGVDILGFARVRGSKTRLDFFRINGSSVSTVSVSSTGAVVVGDYNDGPGEEVALKTEQGGDSIVINPITGLQSIISARKGIAIDAININTFDTNSVSPDPSPSPSPGDPSPPPSSGGFRCSGVVDIAGLPDVLYKNENIHGGRGRTWLDQGHRLGGTRRLQVAGLNGNVFACFGLYACDNPYGCRYYQQMCGDSLSNSQFINAAKQNGGGSTYALVGTGSGTCYRFKADATRYGNVRK